MGAKTWMIAFAEGDAKEILRANPKLNREAAFALAQKLFPSETLEQTHDGSLAYTNPPDDKVLIGCFPGLSIIAAGEFGIDYPSRLPKAYLDAAEGRTVYLHAMHSVVDWFAYAKWEHGELIRSLSLTPDCGILEDIGERAAFEIPFWKGEHTPFDSEEDDQDYPFLFHPLDLGEAALAEIFGYQIEGVIDPSYIEPEDIPLMAFKRIKPSKPWWKFWQ